mmetsp:Transcript_32614/g.72041  ORF Transcript_32614/g.72041 Transcript_32614/m.72041 type:complete len:221 (+) Transcript_32614:2266-2928(+)
MAGRPAAAQQCPPPQSRTCGEQRAAAAGAPPSMKATARLQHRQQGEQLRRSLGVGAHLRVTCMGHLRVVPRQAAAASPPSLCPSSLRGTSLLHQFLGEGQAAVLVRQLQARHRKPLPLPQHPPMCIRTCWTSAPRAHHSSSSGLQLHHQRHRHLQRAILICCLTWTSSPHSQHLSPYWRSRCSNKHLRHWVGLVGWTCLGEALPQGPPYRLFLPLMVPCR